MQQVVASGKQITDADLPNCLRLVRDGFTAFGSKTGDAPDKIAKGPAFVDFLLKRLL